jgi:hypothetical protein
VAVAVLELINEAFLLKLVEDAIEKAFLELA